MWIMTQSESRGSKLKSLRKVYKAATKRGTLTQADMGKLIGVSRSTYQKMELGDYALSGKHLKILAQMTGVDPDSLIDDTRELSALGPDRPPLTIEHVREWNQKHKSDPFLRFSREIQLIQIPITFAALLRAADAASERNSDKCGAILDSFQEWFGAQLLAHNLGDAHAREYRDGADEWNAHVRSKNGAHYVGRDTMTVPSLYPVSEAKVQAFHLRKWLHNQGLGLALGNKTVTNTTVDD